MLLFVPGAMAQEDTMNGEVVIASPPPMVTITPVPDYVMPYPGLLPDNILYGLKTFRDKAISVMVGDPIKKAEFDLLQADKRIGAAIMLLQTRDEKKYDIALSTASKAQNYYEEAIDKLVEAKKQGTGVSEMVITMKRAGAQHIYLLEKEKKSFSPSMKAKIDPIIQRSISLRNRVKNIK